jgi:hypothetical protein
MEEGEEIHLIIHHHLIIIIKPLLINLGIYTLPPIILWLLFPEAPFAWMIWLGIGIVRLVLLLFSYYFNALLVTNLNLVDVEWNGVFNRAAQRIEYGQIESFAYNVNGFLNTILNIGDITINKISGNQINIESIFNPKQRIQLLTKLQDQMVQGQLHKDHSSLKDILTNMLRDHIDEHGIVIED